MAKLVILTQGMTGRAHELNVDRTTIGRVEDNTFQIADPSVSSHHCEVLLRGGEVVIRDLNSTNGSYINDAQITESVLKPGQKLRLGQIELKLETEGAVPAAPALRAKRRRSPIDRPARPDGEPAVGGLDAAPEMAPRDESGHPPADPTPDAAQAPVYRLRKAGTKEAPVGPAVRARDELQRLSDFFQISGSALTQ